MFRTHYSSAVSERKRVVVLTMSLSIDISPLLNLRQPTPDAHSPVGMRYGAITVCMMIVCELAK